MLPPSSCHLIGGITLLLRACARSNLALLAKPASWNGNTGGSGNQGLPRRRQNLAPRAMLAAVIIEGRNHYALEYVMLNVAGILAREVRGGFLASAQVLMT